ncbi:MAG: T9SS type A sorting domain-containing protein [Saprospiraceae bacterium]|nr:T9SS type A sorting domain-containing protein [Saprospiraceae bacterium]
MKKTKLIYALFLLTIGLAISNLSMKDPSNPPVAKTGGPGEQTCSTTSGCHSGGSYQGTIQLVGLPDTVLPSTLYTITFTSNSTTAVRGGYELTCLDGLNVKCGTLAAGSGTNLTTSGGKQYVRQSSAKSYSGGKATWVFNWTSPATAAGDSIKFYGSSLLANGNGGTSGDNAITLAKKVILAKPTATFDALLESKVSVFPIPAKDILNVTVDASITNASINIFDINGKEIYNNSLSEKNQIDISNYNGGTYIVKINSKEGTLSKKILINK